MHEDVFRGRRRVALTSMVAAGAVIALAACSSGGGSGGSGGGATGAASTGNLPASITVVSTNPTTTSVPRSAAARRCTGARRSAWLARDQPAPASGTATSQGSGTRG